MKHQIKTELIRGYCAQPMQLSRKTMDRVPYHKAPRLGPRAFSISLTNSFGGNFI